MRWVWCAALVLVAACGGEGEGISVDDAWARVTPAGVTTGAVYFTLQAPEDDVLLGADVAGSVAASVELHASTRNDGTITMDATPTVELPSGEDVMFEPGGRHVMLVDLAARLVEEDTFELTLSFEHAEPMTVTVEVRE